MVVIGGRVLIIIRTVDTVDFRVVFADFDDCRQPVFVKMIRITKNVRVLVGFESGSKSGQNLHWVQNVSETETIEKFIDVFIGGADFEGLDLDSD